MRDGVTPVIRLSDYKVSDYWIDTAGLDFQLGPTATTVQTKLAIRPNPKGVSGAALVLDGDELELISICMDDKLLDPSAFTATPQKLTIFSPPQTPFELVIQTRINPQANTKLMGLFRSNGIFCTQCEAEGFRRITYFLDRPDVMSIYTVRLEGEVSETQILLANGNPMSSGVIAGTSRHFAIWHDPHPKPSYLFAIVAGDLGTVSDKFITCSGREVALNVYVERGKETFADYAMDSLKRSMRWDEEVFGREYDLDVFNIVAVSDFNMGAMENKGLNVFNDKYILATPETATDTDYANIEAIVAHEYFHNWTGNRITCRDWFQLCLKEGLTVFRDQEFSADMRSRAVKRIEDVLDLRDRQFGEDAGPLAHPVRPEAYSEINNFYTATVYEKGAELVRMLKQILGDGTFRAGMDLYFKRCDGTAATIEDFIQCFADVSGRDLASFFLWYSQSGTPKLTVTREYDAVHKTLRLTFQQSNLPTPGQPIKHPAVIPVSLAIIDRHGATTHEQVFLLDKEKAILELSDITPQQVPSLLRGFSAPVTLVTDLSDADYGVLAAKDSDPFNRWQSIQMLCLRSLVSRVQNREISQSIREESYIVDAMSALVNTALDDPAFAAFALRLPTVQEVARTINSEIDPEAIFMARKTMQEEIGRALFSPLIKLQKHLGESKTFKPDEVGAGRRSLNSAVLSLILAADKQKGLGLLSHQFEFANNMTDRMSSLSLISQEPSTTRDRTLETFEVEFRNNPLVLDKWFTVNALIPEPYTLERVKGLLSHSAYVNTNPNRVRALIGAFAFSNFTQFNRADGEGYRFIADAILEMDAINPQVAARLATAFRTWRTLEIHRRAQAEIALRKIDGVSSLSIDLKDILQRTLH